MKKTIEEKIQAIKNEIQANKNLYTEIRLWCDDLESAKKDEVVDHIDNEVNASRSRLQRIQARINLLYNELDNLLDEQKTRIAPPPKHKYIGDVLYTREELDFEREERELEEETQKYYEDRQNRKALTLLALGIGGVCVLKEMLKKDRTEKHFYCC